MLLIFSILIGFFIAEGISRIIYTEPWYQMLIQEQKRNNNDSWTKIKRNSLGLRGKDYLLQTHSKNKRILILGDSFTFGTGVTNDEAVFPSILQKQLNIELDRHDLKVEVLNGGLPGSMTNHWVDLLQKIKSSFHPDVILIVFFMRDGTPVTSIGSFFKPIRKELINRHWRRFFYRHSYLFWGFSKMLQIKHI